MTYCILSEANKHVFNANITGNIKNHVIWRIDFVHPSLNSLQFFLGFNFYITTKSYNILCKNLIGIYYGLCLSFYSLSDLHRASTANSLALTGPSHPISYKMRYRRSYAVSGPEKGSSKKYSVKNFKGIPIFSILFYT